MVNGKCKKKNGKEYKRVCSYDKSIKVMCRFVRRVNLSSLEALISMGFSRQTAAEALRQSDNSMDKALQVNKQCRLIICVNLFQSVVFEVSVFLNP